MEKEINRSGDWDLGSFPNRSSAPEEYIFDRTSVQIIFIILYTIVFVVCFVGNSLVLLVVSLHWSMRRITKLCLANLAFADLCVGIFCIYQNLSTYLIRSWVLGEFLCKMYQFINALSHTASILTLVTVCIERYMVILHPLTCKRILTKARLRVTTAAVWISSGLYSSPRIFYMGTLVVPRESDRSSDPEIICTARRTHFNSKMFDMINSTLLFLTPLLLMSILYSRVGFALWRRTDKFYDGSSTLRQSLPQENTSHSISITVGDHIPIPTTSPSDTTLELSPDDESSGSGSTSNSISPKLQLKSICQRESERSNCRGRPRDIMRTQNSSRHQRNYHFTSSRSVVKMLIVIVTVFAICHFPFHWRKLKLYWKQDFDLGSIWNTLFLALSHLLLYVNSAINPLIYAFMSTSFRTCLKDVVQCKWNRRSYQTDHVNNRMDLNQLSSDRTIVIS